MTTLHPCADFPAATFRPSRSEAIVLRLTAAAERSVERRIQRRSERGLRRQGHRLSVGIALVDAARLDDHRTRVSGRSLGVWPG